MIVRLLGIRLAIRCDEFKAAIRKDAVAVAAPENGVAEESSDPEEEAHQIFQRQQEPVDSRVQNTK